MPEGILPEGRYLLLKKAEKRFLQKTDLPGKGRSVFLKRGVGREGEERKKEGRKKGERRKRKKLRRKGRKGRKAYF